MMRGTWKHEGLIRGLEAMGATYIKHDENAMFFDVPKNGKLANDQAMLERAAQGIDILVGLKLRIRKI